MMTAEFTLSRHDVQRIWFLLEDRSMEADGDGSVLSRKLREAQELEPPEVPPDLVTMHSRALLRAVGPEGMLEVTLVFPHAANPAAGVISVLAPLGSALFGARVGDTIEIRLRGSVRQWRVERLLYQPEAAGDYHL